MTYLSDTHTSQQIPDGAMLEAVVAIATAVAESVLLGPQFTGLLSSRPAVGYLMPVLIASLGMLAMSVAGEIGKWRPIVAMFMVSWLIAAVAMTWVAVIATPSPVLLSGSNLTTPILAFATYAAAGPIIFYGAYRQRSSRNDLR